MSRKPFIAGNLKLNNTIAEFPDRAALSAEITKAGFSSVRAIPMTFGVVALHVAKR